MNENDAVPASESDRAQRSRFRKHR